MAGLEPPVVTLHVRLIRHLRGLLNAWEDWLKEETGELKENADPQKHLEELNQTRRGNGASR